VIFRRIMLVLLPLLAVGFIFAVMWYLYQDWERSLVAQHQPDFSGERTDDRAGVELEMDRGAGHVVSEDVYLVKKDAAERVESVFKADVIWHRENNTADIERPAIQFFTRRGEIITVLADSATVVTKGTLTNLSDIESGRLWGNVVLVHDLGTPEDLADDIVVGLDEVTFDNETYQMATAGPVLMAGAKMTLTATGMRMELDRDTRRLSAMAFLKDILITFEGGDRMTVSLTAPAPAPAAPAAAPAASASAAASPSTPPAPAANGRAPGDTATATGEPSAEADTGGELWHIDLRGDVLARQADQRLRCERLTLYNRSAAGAVPARSVEAGAAEPSGPGAAPPPDPAAPPPAPEPQKPASPEKPSDGTEDVPPLMTVIADGPLVITPVPEADRRGLGDAARDVIATGSPVVVEDGETRITGASVRYNTKTGAGTVDGKDEPMRMEQPGRLFLTGDRLDFNRTAATAEVTGAGRLRAMVEAAGLGGIGPKGPAPAAEGAPADTTPPAAEEPSAAPASATEGAPPAPAPPAEGAGPPAEPPLEKPKEPLEASWTRGMRLSFFSLPANTSEGMGEIKTAEFHGRAVVKQGDGLLKGEDLEITFSPAEADRGQSVSRLVGHGNVLLKNAPVGGTGVTPGADAQQAGDIACSDLDIHFARDPATGDTQPAKLDASGDVAINDPKGKIRAQQLAVTFGKNEEGETEARFLDARGGVLIDRDDLHAEGEHVRRDTDAGLLLMEGNPARASRDGSRIVGRIIRFSQDEGRASVTGAGELEVPATTDLRGRPRQTPEPLHVRWTKDMFFSDRQNFARFNGSAVAKTGGTELACERLWVHFADALPDEPAATEPAAPPEPEEKTDDGLQRLFGRKRLVRMLAEENVSAVDQRLEGGAAEGGKEGEAVRHRMEISGENLTYLEENRKAYMHGPGRLRILSRDRADEPVQPTPLTPKTAARAWQGDVPPGYARTEVDWTESMAFDGLGNRAYFQGGVEATHVGRGVPGEGGDTRRKPTSTRITSRDLQVVFTERQPETAGPTAGTAAAAAPPATVPAAPSIAPAEPEPPPEERMTVDKLIASGGVLLWVDDRRGQAERLIYQRSPELIRLYRGTEPNAWARLWRENEATQEFGEIAARTITYYPSTGAVDVVDQQIITISPQPTPAPPSSPRLVPAPRD